MSEDTERANADHGNAGDGDGGENWDNAQPLNQAFVQALAEQLVQAMGGANPEAGGESTGGNSTNARTGEIPNLK